MHTTLGSYQKEEIPPQIYIGNFPISPHLFLSLVEDKTYVPISGCVLEHVLTNSDLSYLEKLFYIKADALSLINAKEGGRQRVIALPSLKWATQLGCSRSQVFKLQQSLSEKGYFIIIKDKNKLGQNKRNLIIPTIPNEIFYFLAKTPDRAGEHIPYNPLQECKRAYLDRTKLFIKLNYQLLKTITSNDYLTPFHKILWLDLFAKCYKHYISNNKERNEFSITVSYAELAKAYYCDKRQLSKAMIILEELGFIWRTRFSIKKEDYCQERQDKSLWLITLSLPEAYLQELIKLKDRSSRKINNDFVYNNLLSNNTSEIILYKDDEEPEPDYSFQHDFPTKSKSLVSSYDPEIAEFRPLLNKDFKLNKDIDRLDSKSIFFKKSEFYQSSFEEEKGAAISKAALTSKFVEDKLQNESLKVSGIGATNQTIKVIANKTLKDWYPLTKEQVDELNSRSNREFSLNFANELLLKLSTKYPDHVFNFTNQLMSYLTKVFKYEKHQASQVNHETFKFVREDEQGRAERLIENYLNKIEANLDTSLSAQLKRKIAAMFTPAGAYNVLTKTRFILKDNLLKVKLLAGLNLSPAHEQLLSKEAVLIYGNEIEVVFIREQSNGVKEIVQGALMSGQDNNDIGRLEHEIFMEELDPLSAWYKIRKELQSYYGSQVDKAWFSKLRPQEDMASQKLILQAPTTFIRDWLQTNYGNVIEQYARKLNYRFNPFESIIKV